MSEKTKMKTTGLEKMSLIVTKASGSSAAFLIALVVILIWVLCGPIFHYSDTWQLVINTSTTIITFLMVFLIQRSQNKDSIAIHLKLNELIVATKLASNRLVSIEEMGEEELKVLQKFYIHLADLARQEMSVKESHSIARANNNHHTKKMETKQ